MHKHLKQISIAVIVLIFCSCILYLQYGRDIDASGSCYSGDTLSFNVTLNQLWFNSSTQKDIETSIIRKFNDNSFHSIRFSTDLMHPNHLRISVYLNENDIIHSDPIFTFSPDV